MKLQARATAGADEVDGIVAVVVDWERGDNDRGYKVHI